jgi:hypothetical protein
MSDLANAHTIALSIASRLHADFAPRNVRLIGQAWYADLVFVETGDVVGHAKLGDTLTMFWY